MFKYAIVFLFIYCAGFAQHQDKVDFIKASILIKPLPLQKAIEGEVKYDFIVLAELDSVFLDAKNMNFNIVKLNHRKVKFSNDNKQIVIRKKFKKGEAYSLRLGYSCIPKQTVYFMGWDDTVEGNEQIWTQGQGKYTSYWLPSFDDMEEKVEFDLHIQTHKSNRVIANGMSVNSTNKTVSNPIFSFDMQKPMSSYLLAFAIGKYNKEELVSNSGIPIENYYYPKDSLRVEPTYRYTKKIFDFLETEIGFPYPWQNYKQVPVHDFLYAGMENTSATIFSDGFIIDATAFVDKNYVNVNAHELAHQWFGNLVTEKNSNHHWLHEGFATYYAYLTESKIFGTDHFYWKLYTTAQQLQDLSDRGEGESLLNLKASSLTFYEKGAWALVMLRDFVGDNAFRKGIQQYLKTYQFKNATVAQFLQEIADASGLNLSGFKTQWLETTVFPIIDAKELLKKKSPSLALLFEMEGSFEALQSDDLEYERYWTTCNSIYFKQHLLENYHRMLPTALIQKAFASETIPIRQSLAMSLLGLSSPDTLNKEIKYNFESLLTDESYVTQEVALVKLWSAFSTDRNRYLDQLKGVEGLPNKNVRLLWLTLALVTPEYNVGQKKDFLKELSDYTNKQYHPEIRQRAFQYLTDINALNDDVLKQLVTATDHHSWQFRNFARRLLDALVKEDLFKSQLQRIAKELNYDDLRYLNTKLKLE
ncbi:MAG: aminopeptidase N [Maribacter sp.]|jgi:aminopeptidase N